VDRVIIELDQPVVELYQPILKVVQVVVLVVQIITVVLANTEADHCALVLQVIPRDVPRVPVVL